MHHTDFPVSKPIDIPGLDAELQAAGLPALLLSTPHEQVLRVFAMPAGIAREAVQMVIDAHQSPDTTAVIGIEREPDWKELGETICAIDGVTCALFTEPHGKVYPGEIWVQHDPGLPQATRNAIIAAAQTHKPDVLGRAKRAKCHDIDAKTSLDLIPQGFNYNGTFFSLSKNAQRTYLGMRLSKDALVYPVTVNALDDSSTSTLANPAEVEAFYNEAMAVLRGRLDSGTALKNAVRAATTVAEVNAIVDLR